MLNLGSKKLCDSVYSSFGAGIKKFQYYRNFKAFNNRDEKITIEYT